MRSRERPINKADIIDALSRGRSRAEAREILDEVMHVIALSLSCGEKVSIRNFGKFETRHFTAVTRRNPVSGDIMDIPETISVGFVPSRALKERLNRELRQGDAAALDAEPEPELDAVPEPEPAPVAAVPAVRSAWAS